MEANRRVTITFSVPLKLADQVDLIKDQESRTRSFMICELLREALAARKGVGKK